jgi:hypothetical protein
MADAHGAADSYIGDMPFAAARHAGKEAEGRTHEHPVRPVARREGDRRPASWPHAGLARARCHTRCADPARGHGRRRSILETGGACNGRRTARSGNGRLTAIVLTCRRLALARAGCGLASGLMAGQPGIGVGPTLVPLALLLIRLTLSRATDGCLSPAAQTPGCDRGPACRSVVEIRAPWRVDGRLRGPPLACGIGPFAA